MAGMAWVLILVAALRCGGFFWVGWCVGKVGGKGGGRVGGMLGYGGLCRQGVSKLDRVDYECIFHCERKEGF